MRIDDSILFIAFACGAFVALPFYGWLFFSDIGLVHRLAYRRGLRAGLAQSALPPYLQDLS